VVRVNYRQADKQPTPLLYLQGGPGAGAGISNAQALKRWREWRDYAGLRRDLLLLDRRGTGASGPRPVCQQYQRFSAKALERNLTLQQEWQESRQAINACLTAMPRFNPSHYGSAVSATDINQLGLALGISQWHVLGVSYGSRLALALKASATAGPQIASMVLDSAYPPGRGGLIQWPDTLARALSGFYRACQQNPACQQAWQAQNLPDPISAHALQALLHNSLTQLRRAPMQVDVRLDGLPKRIIVNDHRLLAAVFAASYHRHRWPDVINALAATGPRHRPPLATLMQLFVSQALSSSVTSFTFMAVDCRDNRLGSQAEYTAAVARHPTLAPYLSGMWQGQICHQWPTGPALTLPKPPARVALLAGEFDPITPAQWARDLHRQWPNSQLTVFKGTGHNVLGANPCALEQLGAVLRGTREGFTDCPLAPNSQ
jgi:pimeloyl-ACP methyl ester carboxylesterase